MPSSYGEFSVFQYRSTVLNKPQRFSVQAAKSGTDSTGFVARSRRLFQGFDGEF
jgi:hypothetical protein